ncbi:peptidoglycan recognition family protein [Streptomyces albidoflavus]|uniref:peptidoglycan recognition protein family protein n=1 Tax=Streptomyces albidoflavus TaxID=1886 RepID=UPI0033F30231
MSRAQWGARDYRQPNGATPYSRKRRGVKLHYLGTAYQDRNHLSCAAYVRQLQAQHMDGNGWSDIGYSFVVCTHGYVYEGRGLARRNSANGNTALNEQDYAVLLMVGSSGLTKPTNAQLDGARDAIDYCRTKGGAGTWLGGHRDGYATACPGDTVYAWAKKGAPRPKTTTPEKGLDMDKKQVFDAVWEQDALRAPSTSTTAKTNPTWKPGNALRDTYDRTNHILDAVKSLATEVAALRAEVAQLKKGA